MRKYFVMPKKRMKWQTIHTAVMVAVFFHLMLLTAYAIFKPETRKKDYEFFEVKVVEQEKPQQQEVKEKTTIKLPKSKALVKDMQDFEPAPAPTYKEVPSLPSKAYPTIAPMAKQAPTLPGGSSGGGPPVLGTPVDSGGEFNQNGGWGNGPAGSGDGSGIPNGQGWGGPVTGGDGAGGAGPGGFGGGNDFGNTSLSDKIKDMKCLMCKVENAQTGTLTMDVNKQPQLLNFEKAVQSMFAHNPDTSKSYTVELKLSVDETGKVDNVELLRPSGNRDLDDAALAWGKLMRYAVFYENGKPTRCYVYCPLLIEPK
ncbi:MAG: energy transducer TonB [Candidatus Eremiobacteraeota bacterium]|nr:energy transducer TonB [Candidatus Eremiobacteraeota bacterium]